MCSPGCEPVTDWLNLQLYSGPLLLLFAVGCFGWVVAYADVVRMVLRRQFLEIPAGAVVANIAWEFVWGWVYITDMGMLFAWGYRLWFLMDVVIVYFLFKYGYKQFTNDALRKYFAPSTIFGIACWTIGIYFFVAEGYDNCYGANSGYILNLMMSALYVVLIVRHADVTVFSGIVAWSKMLGTALLTVFNVIVTGDDLFLVTIMMVTFILDVLYIYVYHTRTRQARQAAAA